MKRMSMPGLRRLEVQNGADGMEVDEGNLKHFGSLKNLRQSLLAKDQANCGCSS